MRFLGIVILSVLSVVLLSACDSGVNSQDRDSRKRKPDRYESFLPGTNNYENLVPVSQPSDQSELMMEGWEHDPRPYSPNRIVLNSGGYQHARVLVFETDMQDRAVNPSRFKSTVREALALEGVRNVKFRQVRVLDEQLVDALGTKMGLEDLSIRVWLVSGNSDVGPVKAIGTSMITAFGDSPGTSVEVFIAPVDEFEHLGGYAIPATAMVGTMKLEPGTDMREYGRLNDWDMIEAMADHHEVLLSQLIGDDFMKNMADQQTLRNIMGLDQTVPYGLQDPIFDW